MASLDDHRARLAEAKEEIRKLDADHDGEFIDPDSDDGKRWADLNGEVDTLNDTIAQLERRQDRIAELADRDEHREGATGPPVHSRRSQHRNRIPDDPTRIEEYRNRVTSFDELGHLYRDGAMKVIETTLRHNPHPKLTAEEAQSNVARLLDTIDEKPGDEDHQPREIARRVIITSSRKYQQEFATYVKTQGRVIGAEMERAASLTTTAGGFAVPVALDPTVILVNAGVRNPVRRIARVVQTVGNTYEFITSTGVTAAFSAEAAEVADGAPTLAQPTANVEKAQAFIPGSIEVFEDWANIRGEAAKMFADARDRLESTKFLHGLGHGSNQPQGLIAAGGATAVVTTAATATIAVADIYSLQEALSERWHDNASIVGNRAFFNKVRQLDTAGGANLWVQLQNENPPELLGYPAYMWSDYSSAVTTSAATVATIGDFNEFGIVDRVGASVEFIPHLFHTANNLPSGSRGLYFYWRTTSKPLTPGLQANSAFVSLKLL